MRQKSENIVKYSLSFILAVFFIWLAVRKVDFRSFMSGFLETRWLWIVCFCLVSIAALALRALRWNELLKTLDRNGRTGECWDANNVGNLANLALPGVGEFVRCGYLRNDRRGYDKVLGTAACERVCDVTAIAALLVLALATGWRRFGAFFNENVLAPIGRSMDFSLWWIILVAVLLLASVACTILRFRGNSAACRKISDAMKGLASGFLSAGRMERKWAFVAYTLGIWLCYVLMAWFVMLAVPALSGLNFTDALFISAVGNLASVIPVPGGIGAYHYLIMISLGSLYGAPSETGLLYATLSHEVHAILVIILGIISYFAIQIKKHKK